MKKLKVAIGATLHKKVHQESGGGTEVFAYYLARGLVNKGHDVTMFASSDSKISGTLDGMGTEEEINKVEQNQKLFYGYQLLESERIVAQQDKFDIIHINYFEPFLFAPFSKLVKKTVVYTVHSDLLVSRLWQKLLLKMVKPEDIFIFVSKVAYDWAKDIINKRYIYNGVDTSAFIFSPKHENYLLWLGRVRQKKGIKEAVEAAIKSRERLILSGVMDNPQEKIFFETEVAPIIKENSNIEFTEGPVGFEKKISLYQGAKAFLFPISWEEPFGLTMVEALSCGTPVVAFRRGAVSEVIEDSKTGFIVDDTLGMVEKIKKIDTINRKDCRRSVEEKFTLAKTIDNYENLYYSIL